MTARNANTAGLIELSSSDDDEELPALPPATKRRRSDGDGNGDIMPPPRAPPARHAVVFSPRAAAREFAGVKWEQEEEGRGADEVEVEPKLEDRAEPSSSSSSCSGGEKENGSASLCKTAANKDANESIKRLEHQLEKYSANFYVRNLPRAKPSFSAFPSQLSAAVKRALHDNMGIDKLYSHQSTTFATVAERGENVFLCTSFASGKSLAYTLPLLHEWDSWMGRHQTQHQESQTATSTSSSSAATSLNHYSLPDNSERPRAFLLFPTKALAQDQCQKLKKFEPQFWRVCTFDGDTPFDQRKKLLENCELFLTNPDTLHCFFLKEFRKNVAVQKVLRNLKFVVLDEAHVYTGRFGAHVSCVLRRLRRAIEKSVEMGEVENCAPNRHGRSCASAKAKAKANKGKAKAKEGARKAMKNAGPIIKLNQINGIAPGGSMPAATPTTGSTTSCGVAGGACSTSNSGAGAGACSASGTVASSGLVSAPASAKVPGDILLDEVKKPHKTIFIACSATMVRPLEFFHELVDLDVTVISDSGAGRGSKQVCLWAPTMRARQYDLYEPNAEKRKQKQTKAKAARGVKKVVGTSAGAGAGGSSGGASSSASAPMPNECRAKQTTLDQFGVDVADTTNNSKTDVDGATTSLRVVDEEQDVDSFHHMNDGIYDDIAWSFVQAMKKGIKTVLFVSARSLVELMLDRICDKIRKDSSLCSTADDFLSYDGHDDDGIVDDGGGTAASRVRDMRSPTQARKTAKTTSGGAGGAKAKAKTKPGSSKPKNAIASEGVQNAASSSVTPATSAAEKLIVWWDQVVRSG
eukprot:g10034.t1